MAGIPEPRQPRCLIHHVWMSRCTDCADQRRAQQATADRARLEQATR